MNPLVATAAAGGAAWGLAELQFGGRLDRLVRPAAAWYVALVDELRDRLGDHDSTTAVGLYERQLGRALAEHGPSPAYPDLPTGQTHRELRATALVWLWSVGTALGFGMDPLLASTQEGTADILPAWRELEAARNAVPGGELVADVRAADARIAAVWRAVRELAVAIDRGRPTEVEYQAPGFFDVPARVARGAVDAVVDTVAAPVAGALRAIAGELLYVGAVVAGGFLLYKAVS